MSPIIILLIDQNSRGIYNLFLLIEFLFDFRDMADLKTDADHYFSKASQLFDLKEYDKATVFGHLSLSGDCDNIVYFSIAIGYCMKGDFLKASRNYAISLVLNPSDSSAWNGSGLCLFNLGKYKEAILKFKKAVEVDPKYTQGRLNWGLSLYYLQEEAEAERIVEEALKNSFLGKADIIERYEFQLSSAEGRLAKAENEEAKALLKEQICGYRWILEFVLKKIYVLENEDLYL